MPSLKKLRGRIRSVSNTQQITKAMKMVAAAKLRRSQERATAARAYSSRMGRMVQTLASAVDPDQEGALLLTGRREGNAPKVEIVVCTADRGLCGSYNSGVIRAVRARWAELKQEGCQVTFTFIGRKGYDVLRRQVGDGAIRKVYTDVARDLSFPRIERDMAADLLEAYDQGKFDRCLVVFNTFKSAMSQVLTWRQIIPAAETSPSSQTENNRSEESELQAAYLFEPEAQELMDALLPRNVAVQLRQALVEADASEHGARMTAMDNAVRNAKEMINKLKISFNRTRQAVITKELLEIIGGAESLKG